MEAQKSVGQSLPTEGSADLMHKPATALLLGGNP